MWKFHSRGDVQQYRTKTSKDTQSNAPAESGRPGRLHFFHQRVIPVPLREAVDGWMAMPTNSLSRAAVLELEGIVAAITFSGRRTGPY
jgi:hypothetical protein